MDDGCAGCYDGGKGEVTTSSEESEPDVDEFEWKIDGDNIVITSDDEVMEGVYSDGTISIDLDGMMMTLRTILCSVQIR